MAYYSFALTQQQQKWDTFRKETYALVIALRQWHMYLYGNKFVVKSDHNPLITVRNKKDPRGKTARWLMELEEYDFDLVHIPGKQNVKADFLSRCTPSAEPPPTQLDANICDMPCQRRTLKRNSKKNKAEMSLSKMQWTSCKILVWFRTGASKE